MELSKALEINEHFNSSCLILCLRMIWFSYDYLSFTFFLWIVNSSPLSIFLWCAFVSVLLFIGNLDFLGDKIIGTRKKVGSIKHINITFFLTKKGKIYLPQIFLIIKKVIMPLLHIIHYDKTEFYFSLSTRFNFCVPSGALSPICSATLSYLPCFWPKHPYIQF